MAVSREHYLLLLFSSICTHISNKLTIPIYGLCNTLTIILKGEASKPAEDGVAATKLKKVMDATIKLAV